MGGRKRHPDHVAYGYLEEDIDYRFFRLRSWFRPEWSYRVPLSRVEEERVEELLERCIVVDLHEHPFLFPEDVKETWDYSREGRCFLAYEALSLSPIDCVFDHLMDGFCNIYTKHGWDWLGTIQDLGMRLCDITHQGFIIHCKRVEDILEAYRTGRVAWVAALESATCIENEVDRIDVLYGLGVRCLGICYSEANLLGSGLSERRDGGLTDFGYDCVKRMNKLGMLIDISHAGDLTSMETIEASSDPVVATHRGARALTPLSRMMPDEVLKALAEKGGVIGVEAAGFGLKTKRHPEGGVDGYMEHIEYCIELMGIDHVALGPDTLYGDHTLLYKVRDEMRRRGGFGHHARPNPNKFDVASYVEDMEYVEGLENPNEAIENAVRWMVKHGYSDEEIEKVVGGNALRLLREVW